MKRLITKIILFCSILLLIKAILFFSNKGEHGYRKSGFAARAFNTVFIGSSRTKHSIIPAYFDALNGGETDSYNFGINSAIPPETIDECEKLIEQTPSLKHIFFELSGDSSNYVYAESLEIFSFEKYLNDVKDLPAAKFSEYHNAIFLNLFQPRFSIAFADYNVSYQEVIERGEISIQKALSPETIEQSRQLNLQIEREIAERDFILRENYLNRISRLTEIAESKQIKIYFYIPPRLQSKHEFELVSPIYQRLDKKYKLAVAHFDDSLYKTEVSLDNLHLNTAGAKRFTEILSDAYKKHGR